MLYGYPLYTVYATKSNTRKSVITPTDGIIVQQGKYPFKLFKFII